MLRPIAVIFSLISAASAFAIAPAQSSSQLIISVRDREADPCPTAGKWLSIRCPRPGSVWAIPWGRMTTPLGYLAVEKKIGDNVPVGEPDLHNRQLTATRSAETLLGRDPVTTRIIWLRGLEAQNAHAFQRCIYIHGTPQEKNIGSPASYGCIRMKSSDIAQLRWMRVSSSRSCRWSRPASEISKAESTQWKRRRWRRWLTNSRRIRRSKSARRNWQRRHGYWPRIVLSRQAHWPHHPNI